MNILILLTTLLLGSARFRRNEIMQCGNQSGDINEPQIVQSSDSEIQWLREYEYNPIRLGLYYYELDLGSEADDEYFKDVIMTSVHDFFSKVLLVKRLTGNLVMQLETCGDEIIVPIAHQLEGVPETDLMIYITSDDLPEESFVAYAGACYIQGGGSNNVIAGRVLVNTPIYHEVNEEMKISLMTHEITHILGFTDSLFEFYHKPNGDRYYAEEILITREVRGINRFLVKSPTVLAEARRVFDCEEIEGLELENNGGSGSAGGHWEQRLAFHDYMAAQITADNFYTTFTFALLKDSGWYDIDWKYVQEPSFGAGKGCDFINETCVKDAKAKFDEFCSEVQDRCDIFHLQKGYCDITVHDEALEDPYIYFGDPHIGGKGMYRDYCPIIREYNEGSCRGLGKEDTKINKLYGEIVCPNCRCMVGTLIRDGITKSDTELHTGCYEVLQCFEDRVEIRVGNDVFGYETVSCSFDKGEQVEVPGYSGYLQCPDSNILCGHVPCINNCHGKGKCVNGKCECDVGFGGDACNVRCHEDCMNCTGPSRSDCTSCLGDHTVLNYDGSCGCKVSFREVNGECVCRNGIVGEDGECYENCGTLCAECDILGEDCLVCADNTEKRYGKCFCLDGYSEFNGRCVQIDIAYMSFLAI